MTVIKNKIELEIKDLYKYIEVRVSEFNEVNMDDILDIILFAQKRIERGDFVTRVIFESFTHIDDYLFFLNDFEEICSF
jgi:hypothetical protein